MPMPGMLESIFFEDLIVRNAAFNTHAEIIDGRRWQGKGSWRYSLMYRDL
jgi:hypothetical protein